MTRRLFVRRALTVLVALCIGIFPQFAEAANKFWVGGTGNLDGVDTTHISDTTGGAGGAVYPAAGDTLTFDGASGGGTVTFTAGLTIAALTMGAFTGTIDTNGQTVALSGIFTGSGTGTRTLTLGASVISCSAWTFAITTNLTFNAGTSSITTTGNGTTNFQGGGLTYYDVTLTSTGFPGISGANTFHNLTRTGGPVKTSEFPIGANQTVTGTFTVNGNSSINRVLVRSDTKGTARTITAATVTVTNADFQDITGAGAGSWDLSAITGLSGDAGGNSGITFTTADDNFWIGDTGNWSDSTQWSQTSGGAANGRVPLPQDSAYFDANSFSAGSLTVTQDMPRIGSVDWTGVTNTPTFTTSTVASFFGSITLASGMTLTASTQTYTYEGRGSSVLTSAGKSWAKALVVDCVGGVGTLSLGDAFTTNTSMNINSGSFSDGSFNVTIANLGASNSGTRALTLGTGNTWTLTGTGGTSWATTGSGMTFNCGTATIKYSGARIGAQTFDGAGRTYYNFEDATSGSFALQVTGSNTFNNFHIDASAAARTVLFTAGTTTTVSSMTRDAGTNVITLGSITAASHTLAKTGGLVIIPLNDVSVSYSTATPATTWYALPAGSTDGGNNSGWTFGSPTTRGVIISASERPKGGLSIAP